MEDEEGSTASDTEFRKKWARNPVPPLNPLSDSLAFQQLDMNHYLGKPMKGMPGCSRAPVPIVQMYGVTDNGNSVFAHVHGFSPYFYCTVPETFTEAHCTEFLETLNNAALGQLNNSLKDVTLVVLAVDLQMKESIFGYHGNRKRPFLCVTVTHPKVIAPCKRVLENGFTLQGIEHQVFECYETNFEFMLRFMVDTDVVGCNWIELPKGKYRIRPKKDHVSRCQIEVDVAYDAFVSHPAEGDWAHIAPMRVLSFDIECAGRKGIFPEPEKDPVIQIANMVQVQGETKPFIRNVFALDTCANIVGSQVLSFESEKELLEEWAEFMREVDCDMITGYNIMNFDLPFLINRAKTLGCNQFTFLGRLKETHSKLTETKFSSKAYGMCGFCYLCICVCVIFAAEQLHVNHVLSELVPAKQS